MSTLINKVSIKNFKGLTDVTLEDLGQIAVLFGKNNSGKSTVLHAIDIASLALRQSDWGPFQPKLEIKDLFADVGSFAVDITYGDGSQCRVSSSESFQPVRAPEPTEKQKFKTVLVSPSTIGNLQNRRHRTPRDIMTRLENRTLADVNSLNLLHAVKYYGERGERGLTTADYDALIAEIKRFFPDLTDVNSGRTEEDVDTLNYMEFGKKIDILYSGSGLQHFVDVLVKVKLTGAQVVLLDEPEHGLHPDLQRRFIEYIIDLAVAKQLQVFMSTHSPVILNYADKLTKFRVVNKTGVRTITRISEEATLTLVGDLGIRPSDLFGRDICLMVEGRDDVIYYDHIIGTIYKADFPSVSVGVLQYAGSAAEAIIPGDITIANIVAAQGRSLWIRDRDAPAGSAPNVNSTKFKNALTKSGVKCHVTEKRELEYYYKKELLWEAQGGDAAKQYAVGKLVDGGQTEKFRSAAEQAGVVVPSGKNLRRFLQKHIVSKADIPNEIKTLIEGTLFQWRDEVLGV